MAYARSHPAYRTSFPIWETSSPILVLTRFQLINQSISKISFFIRFQTLGGKDYFFISHKPTRTISYGLIHTE